LVAVPPDMARTIEALCVSFLSTVATVVPVSPRNAKIIRALWELEKYMLSENCKQIAWLFPNKKVSIEKWYSTVKSIPLL
jgi:hypothetical protein